jgi:hypothetical protein
MVEPPPHTRWAIIYANPKFVCIKTFSGYRSSHFDPEGACIFLSPDTGDSELGSAVLEALRRSRFVRPEEAPALFDWRQNAKAVDDWLADIMLQFSYSSKRQAMRKTLYCFADQVSGRILISPTKQIGIDDWEDLGSDLTVNVSEFATADRLGAAVRLALSRCSSEVS